MSDLMIVVDVRDGQTMSQYSMSKSGKLTFANASDQDDLTVTPKNGEPFCENNKTTVIPKIVVAPEDEETVRICTAYADSEFLYTAKIGLATEEDPIVILERSYVQKTPQTEPIVILERLSPGEGLIWGAAGFIIGVALVGLVVINRWRSGGPR